MASSPRVAVVVATYRRPHILPFALRSLIGQTFTDWAAVVVGDATGDATREVVASLGDSRIEFLDLNVNFGEQSGPNNVGVARTSSPLVAFLNHDDLWFPDHLAIAVDTLQARSADLVFSPNLNVHPGHREDDTTDGRSISVTVDSLSRRGRFDPSQIHRATPASSWVVTRSVLEAMGGWRPAGDCVVEPSQDLLFRAHRRGYDLVSTGVATVITIASGTRPGSYTSPLTSEHQWLADRLHDVGLRARLLATDTDACPPPKRSKLSLLGVRAEREARMMMARLGVSPRAAYYRLRRGTRRGGRIDQLHQTRGLGAGHRSASGASVAAIRRAEVLRVCRADPQVPISFGTEGEGHRYTASGWSTPEPWGVWSNGPSAELAVSTSAPGDFALVLDVHAHVGATHPQQSVIVSVDGSPSADSTFVLTDSTSATLLVPFTSRGIRPVLIDLGLPDAWTPSSADTRELAIALHSGRLELR